MFTKATKKKSRARIALVGTSGSGKTYTSLVFAKHLAGPHGKIAVIDTERGSASKYSGDVADFEVCELESYDPREYCKAISFASEQCYDVLVIDSLSHAWVGEGGALNLVDKAGTRSKGNSFAAWREVTPLHNALVDAILSYPGHVIATMRAKTEYAVEKDKNGHTTVRKLGLAPVQRDGVEYEFDVVGDMDVASNTLVITKTRCSKLSEGVYPRPGKNVVDILKKWLSDGVDAPAAPAAATKELVVIATEEMNIEAEMSTLMSELDSCQDAATLELWVSRWAPQIGTLEMSEKKTIMSAAREIQKRVGVNQKQFVAWVEESKKEKAA